MLTSRNVQDIAEGEWSRYYCWRLPRKWHWVAIVVMLLSIISVSLLFLVSIGKDANSTKVVVPEGGTIAITMYANHSVTVTQEGIELPTLHLTPDKNSDSLIPVRTMSGILLFIALILLLAWIARYLIDKSEFILQCEHEWMESNFTHLPNRQSVLDFLKG